MMRDSLGFRRHKKATESTTQHLSTLLPQFLKKVGKVYSDRPDLVLAAWPSIVGPQLAPMTQAVSFVEGVLTVKVKNATLHSLLAQVERPRIVRSLKEKFPNTPIKTVLFRLG